jgi:hypothetical protein
LKKVASPPAIKNVTLLICRANLAMKKAEKDLSFDSRDWRIQHKVAYEIPDQHSSLQFSWAHMVRGLIEHSKSSKLLSILHIFRYNEYDVCLL